MDGAGSNKCVDSRSDDGCGDSVTVSKPVAKRQNKKSKPDDVATEAEAEKFKTVQFQLEPTRVMTEASATIEKMEKSYPRPTLHGQRLGATSKREWSQISLLLRRKNGGDGIIAPFARSG